MKKTPEKLYIYSRTRKPTGDDFLGVYSSLKECLEEAKEYDCKNPYVFEVKAELIGQAFVKVEFKK